MRGCIDHMPAMRCLFSAAKAAKLKGDYANIFRSIYSFRRGTGPVQRFMHTLARGSGLHEAGLDLFVSAAPQRDVAIKQ